MSVPSGTKLSESELAGMAGGGSDLEKAAAALGGKVVGQTPEKAEKPAPQPLPENVTEDDRRDYIRTMLAGEPFSKSYEMFGGSLHITFQTRTVKQNDAIDIQADGDEEKRERLNMLLGTAAVHIKGKAPLSPNPEVLDISFFDEFNDVMFTAMLEQFREFEALCDTMFRKANDMAFWNPTGGHS